MGYINIVQIVALRTFAINGNFFSHLRENISEEREKSELTKYLAFFSSLSKGSR